jgi:hypothetical protein
LTQEKSYKTSVVANTNAVADPKAMMIKIEDAIVAMPAMRTSRGSANLARAATPEVRKLLILHEARPEKLGIFTRTFAALRHTLKLVQSILSRHRWWAGDPRSARRTVQAAIHLHDALHIFGAI